MKLTMVVNERARSVAFREVCRLAAGDTYEVVFAFPSAAPDAQDLVLKIRRDNASGELVASSDSLAGVANHRNLLSTTISLATDAVEAWRRDVYPDDYEAVTTTAADGTTSTTYQLKSELKPTTKTSVQNAWLELASTDATYVACSVPMLLRIPGIEDALSDVTQAGTGYEYTQHKVDVIGDDDTDSTHYPSTKAVATAISTLSASVADTYATQASLASTDERVAALESEGVVRYDVAQNLTSAQKKQACANIGAGSGGGGGTTDYEELENKPEINGVELAADTKSADLNLSASDVGLGNVNNTSDVDKPVSTAVQTALDGKLDTGAYAAGVTNGTESAYLATDSGKLRLRVEQADGTETYTPTTEEVSAKLDADGGVAKNLTVDGTDAADLKLSNNAGIAFDNGATTYGRVTVGGSDNRLAWAPNGGTANAVAYNADLESEASTRASAVTALQTSVASKAEQAALAAEYSASTTYSTSEWCTYGGYLWHCVAVDEDGEDTTSKGVTPGEDDTVWEKFSLDNPEYKFCIDPDTGVLRIYNQDWSEVVWSELNLIDYDLIPVRTEDDVIVKKMIPHGINRLEPGAVEGIELEMPSEIVSSGVAEIPKCRDFLIDVIVDEAPAFDGEEYAIIDKDTEEVAGYGPFAVGDVVKYNDKYYKCTAEITSETAETLGATATPDATTDYWIELDGCQVTFKEYEDDTADFYVREDVDKTLLETLLAPFGSRMVVYVSELTPTVTTDGTTTTSRPAFEVGSAVMTKQTAP